MGTSLGSLLKNRGFFFLLVIAFVMHVATFLVTPIFPIFLEKARTFSLPQIGLILGVGSLAYQAGSLLGGVAADRLGKRNVMMIGAILEGVAMGGYSFSQAYGLFLLFSIINGIGVGFLAPTLKALIADRVNDTERTAAFSWRGIAAHLGIIVAGLTITLLVLGGDRRPFLYASAAFFLLALALLLMLPNDRCIGPDCSHSKWADYRSIWENRRFVIYLLLTLLIWALYSQFALVMPLRGEHVLGSAERIGLIWTINSASVVLVQGPLSRFVIERIRPYVSLVAGVVFIGSGLLLMGFATSFFLLSLSALTFIVGEMMVMPVADSLVGRFAKEELLGAYFGIANFVSGIGTAIGTSTGGVLLQRLGGVSSTGPFLFYGVSALMLTGILGLFAYYTRSNRSPAVSRPALWQGSSRKKEPGR